MALPVQRTLQHIRDEVRARCGFGTQVASAAQKGLFSDFVREAQESIYHEFDFREIKTTTTINTVVGQVFYDWPDGVDTTRTISLQVQYESAWIPVTPKGIEWPHDTFAGQRNFPLRYDDGPQLEIWPEPDAVYPMRLEHYARPRKLYDPSARANNTVYAVGDRVVPQTLVHAWPTPLSDTLHRSHFTYECTSSGNSNASLEPVWPIVEGATVTDGTVTWTARLNTVTMPDGLVARLARYKAKLHYRQPDAEEAMGDFRSMLDNLRAGQQVDRRYVQPVGRRRAQAQYEEGAPWIPPVRV